MPVTLGEAENKALADLCAYAAQLPERHPLRTYLNVVTHDNAFFATPTSDVLGRLTEELGLGLGLDFSPVPWPMAQQLYARAIVTPVVATNETALNQLEVLYRWHREQREPTPPPFC